MMRDYHPVIVTTCPSSTRIPLSLSGTSTLRLVLVGLLFSFKVCSVVGVSLNCNHVAANEGGEYSREGSHFMGKPFPKVSISSLVVGNGDGGDEGSSTTSAKKWTTEFPYNASASVLEVPGDEPLDSLEFLCTSADYPVIWGFRKYQAWIPWSVTTGRELVTSSVNGSEKISQIFKSWLKYGTIRNITQLRFDYPTCYTAEDKCLQSSISVEKDKDGKFNLVAHKGTEYGLDAKAEFGQNINCSIRMGFDKASSTFYCQSVIPGSNITMFPRPCSDVVSCSSVYQSSEKPCLEELSIPVGDCNDINRCAKLTKATDYLPQIAICSIRGVKDATAAVPFFYGLPQRRNLRPSLYLNWNDAVPEDMMQISSLEEPIYVGQKFEVVCNASFYYFGSGMLFEVKEHPINYTFAKGSSGKKYTLASTELVDEDSSQYTINPDPINVIKKIINPNNSEMVFSESTTLRGVDLKVPKVRSLQFSSFVMNSPGTYDIVCKAPMWNSTRWASKTVTVHVVGSVKPTFTSGNKTETLYYEANNKLSCVAYGIPQPVIEWTLDGHALPPGIKTYVGSENSTLSWNNLQFASSNTGIYGNFTCSASNPAGIDEKTFIIIPKDKSSFTAVLVIALLGVLGMILIPAVLFLFWKVKQQTRQLKYLTEEEVEEFLLGKPEFIPFQCDMSTYAYYLPYDTAFEIPKENLHIDFNRILGSGAYGMVIFGQYNNPAAPGKLQDLAIKTSKPLDDGIDFFKALLSELKIMTYIGKHENIINLVGACTNNIQKREVYIALEYCENGSLVSYLRKNRHFFLNPGVQSNRSGGENVRPEISRQPSFLEKAHVQYVKMDDLTNISIAKPQDYANTNSLTILDLFRWSHQIADGMTFLVSKKVIHGDLAARNALLTRDLTAKIGDFGLSKRLMNYDSYARTATTPLPIKWMAIECLQDFKFSAESDIWSYGITLWELFSIGEIPYAGWNGTGDEFLKCLSRGMRLAQPIFCPPEVFEVVVSCWRNDRKMRPSFEDLSQYFIKKVNTFNLTDFHPAVISTDSNPDLNYVTTKSNTALVDEE